MKNGSGVFSSRVRSHRTASSGVRGIEAVWTTQGRLQPGRLVSGERTLVYAGQLPGATLEDQLQVRLRSGPDWQSSSRRLNFHFELDVD